MNKKGFTLIELLITIVILAMIMALSTPNIIKLINKNKRDNYNSTIDSIIKSASIYATTNKYDLFEKTNNCIDNENMISTKVKLNKLDLSKEIKNNCTNKIINKEDCEVDIILDCKTKTFTYKIKACEDIKLDNTHTDDIGRIKDEYFCDDLY